MFLWAPPAARAAVVAWARDAYTVHSASTSELFADLPDDCAGDVVEFLDISVTRTEAQHILVQCSSSEARVWVDAVVAAAVAAAVAVSSTISRVLSFISQTYLHF